MTPDMEIVGTQRKKHRHELGHGDHGPVMEARTTRGIQILLGSWIVGTLLLTIYVLVDISK